MLGVLADNGKRQGQRRTVHVREEYEGNRADCMTFAGINSGKACVEVESGKSARLLFTLQEMEDGKARF